MKKVLITGASGSIGLHTIKYLLAEGKYEITALDLKNRKSYNRLKKYRKRINIYYGDVLDRGLIESLVKDQDIVIHLATCLPPLAEYKRNIADIIEYNGTENIIRTMSYYNPKCYLIYASTTSLYTSNIASVQDKIQINSDDYFNNAKYKTENLIAKKMKNYTILRLPLVLTDLRKDNFIYNINKNTMIETITKEDAAYAFCRCIDDKSKVNRKILNIGGGESCRTNSKVLLNKLLKYHGLSCNYINSSLFLTKSYRSPILKDSDESNKLLNYRNDTLQSYYMRQKRRSNKRVISKFLAKIVLAFKKKENK